MTFYAVTGANGHLGRHLVSQLLERGYLVRAIVRSEVAAQTLTPQPGLSILRAPLDDSSGLREAFEGCEGVFHAAAPTAMWASKPEQDISRPIREGTETVLRAAGEVGVKRIIYTSTAATVGLKQPKRLDEETWNHKTKHPQFLAKIWVEQQLTPLAKSIGIDFISLCPPSIIGPGALCDTPSLKPYRQLLQGELPFLPPMQFHLLDVRDLAEIQIRVMEASTVAHSRYIVEGHYVDLRNIMKIISTSFPHIRLPRFTLPKPLFYLLSLLEALAFPWTQQRELSWTVVRECIGCEQRLNGSRLMKEFEVSFRPVEETLVDTLSFFENPDSYLHKFLR